MSADRRRQTVQEQSAAQPIFAFLLAQGHLVTGVRRPELGRGRSPDFLFELDGETIALEVVRYLDRSEAQKAVSRVNLVERALQGLLRPDSVALGAKIVINLRYDVDGLARHKRGDVDGDAEHLATDVRAALATGSPDPMGFTDIRTDLSWVIDAQLAVLPSPEPGAYFAIAPGLPDGTPDPDGFIDRTVASKADQHVGHATRAILAVLGMFADDAEDLEAAFQRRS